MLALNAKNQKDLVHTHQLATLGLGRTHLGLGAGIAGHYRAVDGGGAAPARQQRAVEIEAAEARGVEDGFWQDEAVCDDHRDVGPQRADDGADHLGDKGRLNVRPSGGN